MSLFKIVTIANIVEEVSLKKEDWSLIIFNNKRIFSLTKEDLYNSILSVFKINLLGFPLHFEEKISMNFSNPHLYIEVTSTKGTLVRDTKFAIYYERYFS